MKKIGKRLIAAALAATLVMMPSGMAAAEEGNSGNGNRSRTKCRNGCYFYGRDQGRNSGYHIR